ncbi:hypothetical protein GDO78_023186 [Eleutherodactylus coqui]|nr:hypothetical protein GDO78_023186 [Eleutherodactylus coqui]
MAAVGRGGDGWQSTLSEHRLFPQLRTQAGGRSAAALKSLVCCVDGDLLTWSQEDCAFHTIRLRSLNGGSAEHEQTLLCINPPLFDVTEVLLNPSQQHIALIGSKGLMLVRMSSMGLKGDDDSLIHWLKIYKLHDHLSPENVIPLSNADETSLPQNRRSYKASLGEIAVAFDFGPLAAVSRSLGRHSKENTAYPLYILYENGETFLLYIDLQGSSNSVGRLLGPLPMHPAAEDNYGYDACSVLCLSCVPNILVIATESGLLYHCVVLEGEDDDEQTSDKSWNPSSELIPSLYVFECVELELALKLTAEDDEESIETDFSCPIKLHRDPVCPSRYHCTHVAGIHSVGLAWFSRLEKFLSAGEEDKDSLQELAAEQKCLVEHILCTKPLPCRRPSPIQGFWIISDLSLGTSMICLTSGYECITRPLLYVYIVFYAKYNMSSTLLIPNSWYFNIQILKLILKFSCFFFYIFFPLFRTTIRPPSPPLLCSQADSHITESVPHVLEDVKGPFENHIRNILIRTSANPLLLNSSSKDSSPPPEECLQLLSRATQVFREEYVLKQDMAREEIQRRVKLLIAQKEKQLKDMRYCNEERKSLKEMAERLAEKYEEAKEKQDDLMNRLKAVLHSFNTRHPVLTDSERDMKKELLTTHEQLHHLDNAIKQVKLKMDYQERKMEKVKSPRKSNLTLSDYQRKNIQAVLKEQ